MTPAIGAAGAAVGPGSAAAHDARLPGSLLLDDPELLRETLARCLAGRLGPGVAVAAVSFEVFRLAPGKRCILALDVTVRLEGREERHRMLGKLYGDGQGATAAEALAALAECGFADGQFTVPVLLACAPEWRLLLTTWSEGQLLRSLLLAGADGTAEMDRAASWLSRLHGCAVTCGRRYTFERHLATLAQWKRRIGEVYPEADELLGRLLARMEERGNAIAGWTPAPTHRDFSPDHIVLNGDHTIGLDFDEFCQYDPLFDVAHFTTHLKYLGLTHFGVPDRFERHAQRFIAAYRARVTDYCAERVRFYRAVASYKLAHVVAVVRRPPLWRETTDTLLREAREALWS